MYKTIHFAQSAYCIKDMELANESDSLYMHINFQNIFIYFLFFLDQKEPLNIMESLYANQALPSRRLLIPSKKLTGAYASRVSFSRCVV